MKKIAFVSPWYGDDIPGGAEMEMREVVSHLNASGVPVEILTTCVREFSSDWSRNYYREGIYRTSEGVIIRRFHVRRRDTDAFNSVNAKLMQGADVSAEDEKIFMDEMINSPALYRYIKEHGSEYGLFVFIPYMFGTTFNGMRVHPSKSVIIPCFHDEPYAHMNCFKRIFPKAAGMIFNSSPEAELAETLYGLSASGTKTAVTGIGMDTDISGSAGRFRRKYGVKEPFIVYAGRKDGGKNVDTLVRYYAEYIRRSNSSLRLILIGGGRIALPDDLVRNGMITDLGFIEKQDKYDAMTAAEFLCQPSPHESFSLVIMESWLCGRPVLVSENCAVTRNFASVSNGGLWFGSFAEFSACTDFITSDRETAEKMGSCGRQYVLENFSWDTVISRYKELFGSLTEKQ